MKRSKLNLDLKSLYNQKSQTTIFNDTCTFVQNETVPGVPSSVFNQEVVNNNVSLEIPSRSNLLAVLDFILVRAQLFYCSTYRTVFYDNI